MGVVVGQVTLVAVMLAGAVAIGVTVSAEPVAAVEGGSVVDIDYADLDGSSGIYITHSDGTVDARDGLPHFGDGPLLGPGETVIALSVRPAVDGYWLFTNLGRTFRYGAAVFHGDASDLDLAAPMISAIATADGLGYYMVAQDGGIFTYGSAVFYGSIPQILAGVTLDAPVIGIVPSQTGMGYLLIASDGGIFTFGDAVFYGSIPGVLPGVSLDAPVIAVVAQPAGYLMVASDGGIFTFGVATFHGSLGGTGTTGIVGVAVRPDNTGYIMIDTIGNLSPFGNTTTLGTIVPGALPGAGADPVIMARANWSTGYFQAEIYKLLLEELGYEVSRPGELELGPNQFYTALAQGQADFWVNSWYPGDLRWHQTELADGSVVGDHVSIVGEEMIGGGLQGFLITRTVAEEYGITHLDQLNDDPAIRDLFDSDGDGVAEIFGCQQNWTCDDIITAQIAFNGWDNITQMIGGYDAMFAEAIDLVAEEKPMVIYTWTPSAYITELRPGDNVVWLAVENVLDDSNPTNFEGGESFDQRPGTAAVDAAECPAVAIDGVCRIGWSAADIQVTLNNEWGTDNPAAVALLEQVRLPVIDVSLANVRQTNGESPTALAKQWIADNSDIVDIWMDGALTASSSPLTRRLVGSWQAVDGGASFVTLDIDTAGAVSGTHDISTFCAVRGFIDPVAAWTFDGIHTGPNTLTVTEPGTVICFPPGGPSVSYDGTYSGTFIRDPVTDTMTDPIGVCYWRAGADPSRCGVVSVFDLHVLDCINATLASSNSLLPVVPCDRPHVYQIYDSFLLDDGLYPGAGDIEAKGDAECLTRFERVFAQSYATSPYLATFMYPNAFSWNLLGDRTVLCLVFGSTLLVGNVVP